MLYGRAVTVCMDQVTLVIGGNHLCRSEVAYVEVIQPRLTELSLSCVIDRAVADIASNVYPSTEPASCTPPIIPAVS
jgi:hypothetical protein